MVGKKILHYKILEKLGQGGMGVVYKAEDTKLKREVAIKFLPQSISSNPSERLRFEVEAQSAAALNHPNITVVYAIEEFNGEVFIVMEYIKGEELKEKIKSGAIDIEEGLRIAVQIAEGLDAAHRKGIIHRDIKSSNIMITADGAAKIMDFGLAKVADGSQLTKTGTTMGTAAYMSPEQARGEKPDPRSDIWSLGVVLYEMLTGCLPFYFEYEQAVIYALCHERHTRASALNEKISSSLDKIIDRCLEKKPSERFQETRELIEQLKLAAQMPEELNDSEDDTISIAVLPFSDISPDQDNKYFSEGLTEEIIAKLSKLEKAKIISRTSVMNLNRSDKTMKQMALELDVRYMIEGSVRKNVNNLRISIRLIDAYRDAYLWADNFNGTTNQIFDFQEDVASEIVKALKIKLTPEEKININRRTTEDTEAYQYYLKGRFFWNKRTADGIRTAIEYFEKAIGIDPNYPLPWSGIADSYNLISELGAVSSKEVYPKAMAAARRAVELDDRLSEAHASLACLLMLKDWDWKSSLKEFMLAIKYNKNYATAHQWYSEWLLFNGFLNEALAEMATAVKLDPLSTAILKDMGTTFYYLRDYEKAIEFAFKSLELDSNLATAYRLLSLAYLGKKMFREAKEENKKWIDHHAHPVESLAATAYCHASAGEKEDALKIVETVKRTGVLNGNTARGIALVYAALGDTESAYAWLEKTFESRSESMFLLKIDPKLDPLRGDPRFDKLIERVGFMQ